MSECRDTVAPVPTGPKDTTMTAESHSDRFDSIAFNAPAFGIGRAMRLKELRDEQPALFKCFTQLYCEPAVRPFIHLLARDGPGTYEELADRLGASREQIERTAEMLQTNSIVRITDRKPRTVALNPPITPERVRDMSALHNQALV